MPIPVKGGLLGVKPGMAGGRWRVVLSCIIFPFERPFDSP